MGKSKILCFFVLIFIFHGACGPSVEEQYEKAQEAFFHEHDYEKAFEIAYPLAKNGYAPAQAFVAIIYRKGGFSRYDLGRSFEWRLKAAKQGHAAAQIDVAYDYMRGWGVEKNEEEGLKWFQKAAENDERDPVRAVQEEARDRIQEIKNGTFPNSQ